MTRKRRRLLFVLVGMAMLGTATGLVLYSLRSGIVFFYSPTDLLAQPAAAGRDVRLGGLVEKGSVAKDGDGVTTRFRVTDLKRSLLVAYKGVLPDLFREGQGVVVEGSLLPDGSFRANEVLAKHDEKYMPPEVAKALKAKGEWRPDAQGQGQQSTSAAP
jgi:cytochrome c-type biogenesis protein CcmE